MAWRGLARSLLNLHRRVLTVESLRQARVNGNECLWVWSAESHVRVQRDGGALAGYGPHVHMMDANKARNVANQLGLNKSDVKSGGGSLQQHVR